MATPRARTPRTPRTPAESQSGEMMTLSAAELDFIPAIYALLARLVPDTPGLLSQPGQADGTAAPTGDEPASTGEKHLDIQQLGPEASAIKVKIQKARAALKTLPDADRRVEEQEDDIRLLEERITHMREMLGGLGVQPSTDVHME